MAYAIAADMGFSADKVDWVANTVFEKAFAPGAKPFDFHMAQISITPDRAKAVTFSDPYFDSNQALLVLSKNPIAGATSIADLKQYKLGAATATTSLNFLENTIAPTADAQVFNDNEGAKAALQAGTVDGIVVDLSTAIYMRDAELDDFNTPEPEAKVVGQFGPPALPDEVGAVLQLHNPLVDCVNAALAQLKSDGTHQAILDTWINTGEDIPFLK
jgi:polar amino acid transport system substrate-binding protein